MIFGGQKRKERYSQEEKEYNKEGRTKLETSYVPIFNIVYACKILLYRERELKGEVGEIETGRDELTGSLAADFTSLSLCLSHYCLLISEEKREKKAMGREKNIKIVFFSTRLTDFLYGTRSFYYILIDLQTFRKFSTKNFFVSLSFPSL